MANLGFLTIWNRLNSVEGFICDRAFWDPRKAVEPVGIDTGLPLSAFPLIFISSSFDLDLISVIDSLIKSRIDPESSQRSDSDPIIVAGGMTVTLNPFPWSAVIDCAILGEGEVAVLKWLDVYERGVQSGSSKAAILEKCAELPFVWSPEFPHKEVATAKYHDYPHDPAISHAVHPKGHFGACWLIEINRGCPRKCQFCAVCTTFPARFADLQAVLDKLKETDALGAPKIGLVGAAVGDHPNLKEIVAAVIHSGREITLSSLRIERTDEELLKLLVAGGCKTLTVAPETGSESLRFQFGKKSSDDDLIRLAQNASRAGFQKLRLYFLIGLPDPEPPEAIYRLINAIRKETPRSLKLDLSVSTFIPKPGTPWEAAPFASTGYIDAAKKELRTAINSIPRTSIRFESTRTENIAALISRGDLVLGEALLSARIAERPLQQELRRLKIDLKKYLQPSYSDSPPPWHCITTSL